MKNKEAKFYAYLSALLEGNIEECFQIILSTFEEDRDPIKIYIDIFQRSLYRIGELWDKGKISVAEEHLATQITEELMHKFSSYVFKNIETNNFKVIVASVAKEFHEIGARMVADIFRINGWQVYFLGSNTPTNDLLKIIGLKKPDAVALSLTFYLNITRLIEAIRKINENYPSLKIFVGGQAFSLGGTELLNPLKNVNYISSIESLNAALKNFENCEKQKSA